MNKSFIKKLVKLVLALAIIVILIWVISNTYSKYINSLKNASKIHISNWNILINDQNVTEESDFTDTLEFELDESDHIEDDVIVPTSSGHFSVNLDSTGTDLPFDYEFSIAENVDVNSTYNYTTSENPAGNDTEGYTYQIHLTVDYEFLNRPVIYGFRYNDPDYVQNELGLNWEEGVAYGKMYNGISIQDSGIPYDIDTYGAFPIKIPIVIDLPAATSVLSVEGNPTYNFDATGHKLTFQASYQDWYRSDNSNKTVQEYESEWDPNINVTEKCTTNTIEYTINVKYVPPSGETGLPVAQINAVSIDGRVITQKSLNDFKITQYKLNNDPIHVLEPGETTVSGHVDPSLQADGTNTGNDVINSFIFWVEWYDGNDNTLNNFEDVMASKMDNPTGVITVKAKITQTIPAVEPPDDP